MHPQFLASLSGLNLSILCPVLVSPIFIHTVWSPVAVAIDAIQMLNCKDAAKKALHYSTLLEKTLAICIEQECARLHEPNTTAAMERLSDASPGLC